MTNKLNYFFFILFLLLPLTLITGPAIPDLTITIAGIYYSGLFFISLKNNYNKNIVKLFFITMIFWVSLNLISFFAENKLLSLPFCSMNSKKYLQSESLDNLYVK